jgi:LPXTG-motif cell wall-anchored protein
MKKMNVKKLISSIMVIALLLGLCSFSFAAEGDKLVQYKEANLYRSRVYMEPDYITEFQEVDVLSGNTEMKYYCKIDDKEMKPGDKMTFTALEEYTCKVINGSVVLGTKEGKLEEGLNKIDLSIKFMNKTITYRFKIKVTKVDSKRIDKDKFNWVKVENSSLKWKMVLTYGQKFKKEFINLGETKETGLEKVYSRGYVELGKSKWYTGNVELCLGDNGLNTKPFQIEKYPRLWWKGEFIVGLTQPEPSVSPSDSTTVTTDTPVPTDTPSTTGTDEDQLPKTGETNPIVPICIGLGLICASVLFIVKKKEVTNC